jgi:triphosphoribosyl-dephospho-CoA synthase
MNLAEQIEISCLVEATARKPGNVHPAASFVDLNYDDFVAAARAIADPLAGASRDGLGLAVLNAIRATRQAAGSNVNLGIALLIAPLSAVPAGTPLSSGICNVLARTTVEDAEQVYEAIRLARPGGLGQAESQDVNDHPTVTLRAAMALAADRDKIAEQYSTDFALVLGSARSWLVDEWHRACDAARMIAQTNSATGEPGLPPWEAAIIRLQLKLLAHAPDSLVARKCGLTTAIELQNRAADLCGSNWPDSMTDDLPLRQFDEWLRADGHRRNPGTTADLIVATLFAAARDGLIELPTRDEIAVHAARIRQKSNEGSQS